MHPGMPPADSPAVRWGRRAVTLPLYVTLGALAVPLSPVLVAVAGAIDAARGAPWVLVRCLLFFVVYLLCEIAGIVAAFALWLAAGPWTGASSRERYLRGNLALQKWWGGALFAAGQRLFSLRVEIEGLACAARGPYLFLLRHASTADTVLPVVFVSRPFDVAFRYVLKRELLWDPCLDLVGNRLPNAFVRRGSGESENEVRLVQRLLEGLEGQSAVLIYPEGTRFTPAKRAALLERLEARGESGRAERARGFRHVLPPRRGGTLGLLARNPGVDVVFCAHTGFEGARSFREFLDGSLVGAVVRMRLWRIPFAEIPREPAAAAAWLDGQWSEVDRWVGSVSPA